MIEPTAVSLTAPGDRPGSPRTALISGAARGIGLACAQALARQGHRVHATYLTTKPPEEDGITFHRLDVRDRDGIDELLDQIGEADGPPEILVGNAAILRDGMAFRMPDEKFLEVLDVDFGGNVSLAQRVLPGMTERGWGRVVLMSSVGGITGSSSQSNYATAKAALHGFARATALEVAPSGVTVNVVAPGPIDTELMRGLSEKHFAAFAAVVPAGRMGHVDEVASAVAFLSSESAAFITGVVLPIDGGLLLSDGFLRSNRERVLMARRAARDAEGNG